MADAALAMVKYLTVFRLDLAASIRRRPIRDHFDFVALVARLDALILEIGRNHFFSLGRRAIEMNQVTLLEIRRRLSVAAFRQWLDQQRAKYASELAQIDSILRPFWAGNAGLDFAKIEFEVDAVIDLALARHPEHLLRAEISLEGAAFFIATAGRAQVIHRLGIDRKIAHCRTVLGRHVADRGPIRQRQRSGACAVKFNKLPDHLLRAQHLGDVQCEIRGGNAFAQRAGHMHADDFGREEVDRLAEHAGFRFNAANAPTDDTEAVDHRRVGVGSHQRIRVEKIARMEHALGEILKVDLVHDADARRDEAESLERLLSPFQKFVALAVAFEFHVHVQAQGRGGSGEINLHGVIDDEIDRHERLNDFRLAA